MIFPLPYKQACLLRSFLLREGAGGGNQPELYLLSHGVARGVYSPVRGRANQKVLPTPSWLSTP